MVEADRATVTEVLRLVQGHPKLLELADAAATDRAALDRHLTAARAAAEQRGPALATFFTHGESSLDDTGFLDVLTVWTTSTMGALSDDARPSFQFLCLLEDDDRTSWVVAGTWADLWRRLERPGDPPDLAGVLRLLVSAALAHPEPVRVDGDGAPRVRYEVHPGVAEVVRAAAPDRLRPAVDAELAAWWCTGFGQARSREGGEHTGVVVQAGLAAVPTCCGSTSGTPPPSCSNGSTCGTGRRRWCRRCYPTWTTSPPPPVIPAMPGCMPGCWPRSTRPGPNRCCGRSSTPSRRPGTTAPPSPPPPSWPSCSATWGGWPRRWPWPTSRSGTPGRRGWVPGPGWPTAPGGWRFSSGWGEVGQVLAEVEILRGEMVGLYDLRGPDEAVDPWRLRENILYLGVDAAQAGGRWQQALDLNTERLAGQQARGAGPHRLASTRFDGYGPLLRLGRIGEVDTLLRQCQQVFEDHQDIPRLGAVLGARADVADERGHPTEAVGFEQAALRHLYVHPDPDPVAVSHHNLAGYLSRADGGDPAGQVAHRLAAALLRHLAGMQRDLAGSVRGLALDLRTLGDQASVPATVAELAAQVEQVEGVHFADLVRRLQPDPDAVQAALDDIFHRARELPTDPEPSDDPPTPA